jgi:cyanophycin synthetase
VRLIEIRALDGPNLYRLEPALKLEVVIGRRRTWYGQREPARHALVRLAAPVPRASQPRPVAALSRWVDRLRRPYGPPGPRTVHRSSDPGYWIVVWPWAEADRARLIAEAAFELVSREVPAERSRRLTPGQARLLRRLQERIAEADGRSPEWVRDAERRVPVVSVSGTNGKTTTTRLVAHILRTAGRRVGATTSDGIVVNGVLVDPGDWTGPGGAQAILARGDVDVAVLETARGGILLRGVGYESNEVAVITNVSSDHLDVQGIHTLPELAEVKAVIARITRPDGCVVLNADDRHVAGIARSVRAPVALFSLEGDRSARVRRHLRRGGRAWIVRDGVLGEVKGTVWRPIAPVASIPIAFGGAASHNVANALAAAAAARALRISLADVGRGIRSFAPTEGDSPGRLNVFRSPDGAVTAIVDFAHNEAGLSALLDVATWLASGARVTAIIGTAGDRPDDTLRGLGRIAAERADRVVIKETIHYLRGRSRASVVGELTTGARSGGWREAIEVYETETAALRAELERAAAAGEREVVVLLCHEERPEVFTLLGELGFRPADAKPATRVASRSAPRARPDRRRPSSWPAGRRGP